MKYQNKCTTCHRSADKKFRGVYLCDDCLKEIKRTKGGKGVWGSIIVGALGSLIVWRDIKVAFKKRVKR